MIFLIFIVLILVFAFFSILFYFFNLTFVKNSKLNVDNLNSSSNAFLKPYAEVLKEGMDYIERTEHKRYETVSFDGLKLFARYYDNKQENTIILFHGYRSSAKHDFSCAVKMYCDMGFNVLLVDQRSHGLSEGKLITFGVKESRDVISWIEFLNAKFKPKQIVLSGLSMGASTVLFSLKYEMPLNVKCVIADCGFTSPIDIIKKVAKQNFKLDADFFIPIFDIFCRIFGKFSIKNISTVDIVKRSKIPILLIHGKNDNFVPYQMSQEVYNTAKDNVKLVLVDGADHGISFLVETELVIANLKEFLQKNLY